LTLILAALAVASASGQDGERGPTLALTTARAESLVREVSAAVEELRRLRFKTPVVVEVVDAATARKDFAADIDDAERESARHTRDAWAQLGLVPETTDLISARLEMAEKDVLGYYHAGSKTFRVLDHVEEPELRSVMAHELTHALEDQYYDLAAVQSRAANDDQATAIRAVIEGSAMVSTLRMLVRQGGIGKAKQEASRSGESHARIVEGAPSFLKLRLLMPYTLGFSFLLRGKPWELLSDGVRVQDIDHAYRAPPYSTREILHPEQYWDGRRGRARPLALPDLTAVLGPGWTRAVASSIGELGLTSMTGAHVSAAGVDSLLPTRWITPGATGNAGDACDHYVDGTRKVTVLLTRWESARDGDEFVRALRLPRRTVYRAGVNVVVLVGDFGGKGEALAGEAVRGLGYWAGE
jgi:hypothetical protein